MQPARRTYALSYPLLIKTLEQSYLHGQPGKYLFYLSLCRQYFSESPILLAVFLTNLLFMFIHHVFFWLKPELDQTQQAAFEAGVKSLLAVKTVKIGDVGQPATTDRPVIDRSYSYSLLLAFETLADHDAYQVDPIHLKFVDGCQQYWQRVQIYDSETV